MFKTPKALLFDFDGVVVDSKAVHFNAWRSAFRELFKKEIVDFPETYTGKSPLQIAGYFAKTGGNEKLKKQLYFLKDRHLVDNKELPVLLPGIIAIQKWAVSRKIPYGIASNATRQFLKKSIIGLSLDFPIYFGFEDYIKPKPNPEAYRKLARSLQMSDTDLDQCWVFEDSLVGLKAAREAGMFPVGILTQYKEQDLKQAGANLVFSTCKEAYLYLVGGHSKITDD